MSEPKLSDLDRCLHGRHAIDNCFDCPGGWSAGNPYLVDGQRIGTDLYGRPILVGRVKGPIRRGPDQQPLAEFETCPLCGCKKGSDAAPAMFCSHDFHAPGGVARG